ncbi:molybdate ABC transporter substrate-binding protein [Castellaniella sp.]|jgi:molybdate transport system substrate-binding protein|uniref:molybdate ABC transporter substrate-binding protein n=1 Tax=Castellaniella sp. TaxID=1955812 RepID=UPI003A90ECFC
MWCRRFVLAGVLSAFLSPAVADEILVSAASSLTQAFTALAAQYQAAHPDTIVRTSFGASDVVLRQILEGAPADIFASADQKAMDKAAQGKAIDPASRTDFVRNQLVLVVPRDNPAGVISLQDLAGTNIHRIALGNPASVPVGRYTQAALQKAGLWDTVRAHEILGQNVRQVLSYVERGEVDAGFVFATDAAIMKDKVKVVQTVQTSVPVVYPIALVQRPDRAAKAKSFLQFVLSDTGQAVLAQYGFSRP